MKKLIHLILLIAISFSITHGVVLDTHQDEHCSVQEYVTEFSQPIEHDMEKHQGDLCNTHFMLHISFLLPRTFSLLEIEELDSSIFSFISFNPYFYKENSFRPPIA